MRVLKGRQEQYLLAEMPWSAAITVAGLLLVLYATLFPFDFAVPGAVSWRDLLGGLNSTVLAGYALRDLPGNVLLFLPFGFGLSCFLLGRGLSWRWALITSVTVGVLLSYAVEVAQSFLWLRFSSMADVGANMLGALLGGAAAVATARHLHGPLLRLREHAPSLAPRALLLVAFAYFSVMLIIALLLQQATTLATWDSSFSLLIGNEANGGRPWIGEVSELYIARRALSPQEVAQLVAEDDRVSLLGDDLLALYRFADNGDYEDEAARLPRLSWQGVSQETEHSVLVGAEGWLTTAVPAVALSDGLGERSTFTIGTTLRAAEREQSGPARIISFSAGAYQRNFTLGQEGDDLVFRLRTPFTGENGRRPEMVVPDLFADGRTQQIVVTYDGATTRFFVDARGEVARFQFTPEVTFFWALAPVSNAQIRLGTDIFPLYATLYNAILFLPLGFLLSLTIFGLDFPIMSRWLLLALAALLPSLVFVAGLNYVASAERALLSSLFMGTIFTTLGLLAGWGHRAAERRRLGKLKREREQMGAQEETGGLPLRSTIHR